MLFAEKFATPCLCEHRVKSRTSPLKRMEASCFSVSTTFLRVLQSDTVSELVMLRDGQPYLTGRLEVTDGGMIFGFDFLLG